MLGLADHITYSLLDEGYFVQKYVPFGRTEIIIPYLLRRATEAKTALDSVYLQKKLMNAELWKRMQIWKRLKVKKEEFKQFE